MLDHRIVVLDDSRQTREIWGRYIDEKGCEPVLIEATDVAGFLEKVQEVFEDQERFVDGIILDMQFDDGDRAGIDLWDTMVGRLGRKPLGELMVGTKFSSGDVYEFAKRNNAIVCTSMSSTHRKAKLDELIARINNRQSQQ